MNYHHVYMQGKVNLDMFTKDFAKKHTGKYEYVVTEIEGNTEHMRYQLKQVLVDTSDDMTLDDRFILLMSL